VQIKTEAQELANIRLASRGAEKRTGIFEPQDLIRRAIEQYGDRSFISWSGGRCSTCVLFMALKIKPDIKVIFTNTGVEYPETVKFVEKTSHELNLDLIITKPSTTFWEVCKEHGFPYEVRAGRGKPACCRLLKEYPLRNAVREQMLETEITGIRVAESRARMFYTAQAGQFYFVKKYGLNIWKYNPIAFWTTSQLLEFERENSIPENPVYEKYGLDRCGCWPCTGYLGWQRTLARVNPRFYSWITKQMGPQRILEHFYDTRIAPCRERG